MDGFHQVAGQLNSVGLRVSAVLWFELDLFGADGPCGVSLKYHPFHSSKRWKRAYLLQIGLLKCFDEQQPPLQQTEKTRLSAADRLLLRVDWGPPFPMQQKAERAYLLQIGLLLCFDEQQPPLQQTEENAPICCR